MKSSYRSRIPFLLLAALLCELFARAASGAEVLTFQGLKNLEPIDAFYGGGTGGFGSTGGPNYGIQFSSDSLALINSTAGGSGNTADEPSGGDTCAFFLSGPGDTMNVAGGFTGGFSFYYSAPFYTGDVYVYSGLNGTGTLLATLPLSQTADGSPFDYSNWTAAGASFSGPAESALFTGVANYIVFDNITLGSATPSAPVPDTGATAALLGLAMAGLGLIKLRAGRSASC